MTFTFRGRIRAVTPKERLIYKIIFKVKVPPPDTQEEQKPPEADFPQLLNQLHYVHVIQNSCFPFLISFLGHWYRNVRGSCLLSPCCCATAASPTYAFASLSWLISSPKIRRKRRKYKPILSEEAEDIPCFTNHIDTGDLEQKLSRICEIPPQTFCHS